MGAPPLPGPRRAQAAPAPRSETELAPYAGRYAGALATGDVELRVRDGGLVLQMFPKGGFPKPGTPPPGPAPGAPPSAPGTAWSGSSPRCRTPAPTSSAGPTGASPGSASADRLLARQE